MSLDLAKKGVRVGRLRVLLKVDEAQDRREVTTGERPKETACPTREVLRVNYLLIRESRNRGKNIDEFFAHVAVKCPALLHVRERVIV